MPKSDTLALNPCAAFCRASKEHISVCKQLYQSMHIISENGVGQWISLPPKIKPALYHIT